MSGKPAARQGDMTQYGGSIVQGSAGVRIGAPTGVACSVCPGGVTSGHPVNPLLGAKVLPGETDLALPGPLPFILSRTYSSYRTKTPAPVGSLGPGWKMPADIRVETATGELAKTQRRSLADALQQSGGEDGGSVVFPPVLVQMLDRLESEILADRVSEESRRWLASCGLTVEQMQNQMDPVYTPARKIHLYHCDHRGLPLALISTEGATAWCAEYDEWGNLLNEENPHQLQQLIRLPGQQYDEESGLYYNRHRYYDPLQGRYITQDPIGLKGGWNFYQYPLNPVTNTDPLGLEVFPRPFPLPIPWPKSPAQQQADDNAAKALTKWWNDTASQRIFDSLILNNPGLALDITMIASRGNVADTGITDRVNDIINDRFLSDGKKPDRCDVLQELIDCGDISAKDAKSTQKAWNCRHSRQSNDKKR
nr:polymorphic toxin type 34 domain-containing protein [Escherichia coli]